MLADSRGHSAAGLDLGQGQFGVALEPQGAADRVDVLVGAAPPAVRAIVRSVGPMPERRLRALVADVAEGAHRGQHQFPLVRVLPVSLLHELEERFHGRLGAEPPERQNRVLAHMVVRVGRGLQQRLCRTRVPDLAQCLHRAAASPPVLTVRGLHQRGNGLFRLHPRQRLDRVGPDLRGLIIDQSYQGLGRARVADSPQFQHSLVSDADLLCRALLDQVRHGARISFPCLGHPPAHCALDLRRQLTQSLVGSRQQDLHLLARQHALAQFGAVQHLQNGLRRTGAGPPASDSRSQLLQFVILRVCRPRGHPLGHGLLVQHWVVLGERVSGRTLDFQFLGPGNGLVVPLQPVEGLLDVMLRHARRLALLSPEALGQVLQTPPA